MYPSKMGTRILVNDVQKCFDFYTEKLGYEVFYGSRESGIYISFKVPGGESPTFAIFKKENNMLYEGYKDIGQQSKSDYIMLCTSTEDVDEVYEKLKSKGVEFIGEPRNMDDWEMRCVWLRDPEDNLIEISGPMKE